MHDENGKWAHRGMKRAATLAVDKQLPVDVRNIWVKVFRAWEDAEKPSEYENALKEEAKAIDFTNDFTGMKVIK